MSKIPSSAFKHIILILKYELIFGMFNPNLVKHQVHHSIYLFIYLFGVLRRFQHCTGQRV